MYHSLKGSERMDGDPRRRLNTYQPPAQKHTLIGRCFMQDVVHCVSTAVG